MKKEPNIEQGALSRRDFVKVSAAISVGSVAGMSKAFAAGSDKIRLGVIGCGGRGRHDSSKCLKAVGGVELARACDTVVFCERVRLGRALPSISWMLRAISSMPNGPIICSTGIPSPLVVISTVWSSNSPLSNRARNLSRVR